MIRAMFGFVAVMALVLLPLLIAAVIVILIVRALILTVAFVVIAGRGAHRGSA